MSKISNWKYFFLWRMKIGRWTASVCLDCDRRLEQRSGVTVANIWVLVVDGERWLAEMEGKARRAKTPPRQRVIDMTLPHIWLFCITMNSNWFRLWTPFWWGAEPTFSIDDYPGLAGLTGRIEISLARKKRWFKFGARGREASHKSG